MFLYMIEYSTGKQKYQSMYHQNHPTTVATFAWLSWGASSRSSSACMASGSGSGISDMARLDPSSRRSSPRIRVSQDQALLAKLVIDWAT